MMKRGKDYQSKFDCSQQLKTEGEFQIHHQNRSYHKSNGFFRKRSIL